MIDFAPIARDYYQNASPACRAAADPILELLSTGFQITWFQQPSHQLIWHVLLKPHPPIRDQFGLTREYFLIGHGYANDFHQRTLLADPPKDLAFRVDRRVRFVSSSSPLMKDAVASWATERKISIVPIAMTAPQPGAQVDAARRDLYALLQTALWRRDLFDDSEPVRNTSEFFGRENDVDEILGKTLQGQPVALLGLRKIGKSSLLGRVQDLLNEHPSALILTAFLRCNATRIKSGRWWTLLDLLLREWRNSLQRRTESLPTPFNLPDIRRVARLISDPTALPEATRIAAAFEKDFEILQSSATALARLLKLGQVSFVAFFDEADEIYPHAPGAGYWRQDYFLFWNTLQALKRGQDNRATLTYNLGAVNPAGIERGALVGQANPLFELSSLYLGPMSLHESRQLLEGLGERMGLVFGEMASQRAYEISGGHPWLLRKLGSKIHEYFIDRGATKTVASEDVEQVFTRSRRAFYAHVDWILNHLKRVAPDEYRLLYDIASGGRDRYVVDWADHEFRDVFAEHLSRYGLVQFEQDVPTIGLRLLIDSIRHPSTTELTEQLLQLRETVDQLEHSIRTRLAFDLAVDAEFDEIVDLIVNSIPKEAANRAKDREGLRSLGHSAGITALMESLNWGDYLILVEKFYERVRWSGSELAKTERLRMLRDNVTMIQVVRHNNRAELRNLVERDGFDVLYARIVATLEMVGG